MYGTLATSLDTPAVAYTASKHGVLGLTRADAIAYAPRGIRINAICPGYVATPLVEKMMKSSVIQKEIDKIPVGRLASMDEIADHITFLASPMSSYMYGAGMVADG
jgi:NAD(P)-dependent dehydrogenase (short-subunit alcohol dehydrogenase family)